MDGFYQLDVVGGDANSESAMNVSFWEITGSDPTIDAYGTAVDLGHQFHTLAVPSLLASMGNNVGIDFLRVRKVDAPTGPYAKIYVQTFGTFADGCDSLALAADIRLKPGGLKNRPGHWFVWALPDGGLISGRLTTAYRAILQGFANLLATPLPLSFGQAIMQTRTRFPSPTPPTYTPVSHVEIAIKITGMNKRTTPVF